MSEVDFSQQGCQDRNFMFSFEFTVGNQELTARIVFLHNFIGIMGSHLYICLSQGKGRLSDSNIVIRHQVNFFRFQRTGNSYQPNKEKRSLDFLLLGEFQVNYETINTH